jgi:hypothetical protein
MATWGFASTLIIFNTTGYSLQHLNSRVLISPEFIVIRILVYSFLDSSSCPLCCLTLHRLCHFFVLSIEMYLNLLIISSYYCWLFSGTLFLHLCIAICYQKIILSTSVTHYILVMCELHSLLRYAGGFFLLLHLSFYFVVSIFSIKSMLTPCHLFQCFIITDFNEKGRGRRESFRENERKGSGMRVRQISTGPFHYWTIKKKRGNAIMWRRH